MQHTFSAWPSDTLYLTESISLSSVFMHIHVHVALLNIPWFRLEFAHIYFNVPLINGLWLYLEIVRLSGQNVFVVQIYVHGSEVRLRSLEIHVLFTCWLYKCIFELQFPWIFFFFCYALGIILTKYNNTSKNKHFLHN